TSGCAPTRSCPKRSSSRISTRTRSTPSSSSWPSRKNSASRSPTRTRRRSPRSATRSATSRKKSEPHAVSAVEKTRVVITGLGAVTPVGNTAEEFWGSLTQGKSAIGPITRFDSAGFPTRIAGEVKGFDALKYVDKKDDRKLDLYLKYALACAVVAVADAALDPAKEDGDRFGVLVGSGIGGISTLLESHKILLDKGLDRVSPFFIPMLISNMAPRLISIRFGVRGAPS